MSHTIYRQLPALLFALSSIVHMSSSSSTGGLRGQARTTESTIIAVVAGKAITEVELLKAAANALDRWEAARLRFEAKHQRDEYEILKWTADGLVADSLLALEAGKRKITIQKLLALEVNNRAGHPSLAEINEFYKLQKATTGRPPENATADIRKHLRNERQQKRYVDFIEFLKQQYPNQLLLKPFRVELETLDSPSQGPVNAPVTIVEFSDMECSFCSNLAATLRRVRDSYGDRVRLVFRQFPLTTAHPRAQKAAEALLCAEEQDRFWQLHDRLFEDPSRLSSGELKANAARLGLQEKTFNDCLDSGRYANKVGRDVRVGLRAGVSETPTLFINGRPFVGALPYEEITKIIESELKTSSGLKNKDERVR